ncbi:uncharacterized protein LOC118826857 isoform X2 [Colossoma macropomum]|uniref:uncharacterized protein LOC118826857 isoform X2 n=1 Tax=Colossoma macropomum TaxID=42526 RepID=UPI001863D6D2|nr:uncharacterized protein LOC118826857 isoform X2 [Colossoma macropomum]
MPRISVHCVLILLIIGFITVTESAVLPVTVKLNDSATLPCYERCSGLVRWTVFSKPTDALAECDQTSCRSKEGYQMIHDQYLKGNLSLTITDADFTKRARYTSDCDGKDLCDVHLKIEPLNFPIQIKTGQSLVLKLDVSDPVEVIYNSTDTAGPSSDQICTVDGRSTQCKPEYTQRASLTAALELRGMTPSDSGVYTVIETRNEEVLHKYEVTVEGDGSEAQDKIRKASRSRRSAPSDGQSCLCRDQGAAVPVWLFVLSLVLVGVGFMVLVVVIVRLKREIQRLQAGSPALNRGL